MISMANKWTDKWKGFKDDGNFNLSGGEHCGSINRNEGEGWRKSTSEVKVSPVLGMVTSKWTC